MLCGYNGLQTLCKKHWCPFWVHVDISSHNARQKAIFGSTKCIVFCNTRDPLLSYKKSIEFLRKRFKCNFGDPLQKFYLLSSKKSQTSNKLVMDHFWVNLGSF